MKTTLAVAASLMIAGAAEAQTAATTATAGATETVVVDTYEIKPVHDWRYKATIYAWIPGIDSTINTPFGDVNTDTDPNNVLKALNMAFMGTLAASNGTWTFAADLLYANLETANKTPLGVAFKQARVETNIGALSGYAFYNVTPGQKLQVDLGGGFRTFDVSMDLKLKAGALAGRRYKISGTWTDPLIAARLLYPINDRWFINSFADYGGTSSDDKTWQIYAGMGYQMSENWATQFGYRTMNITKQVDGKDTSTQIQGVLVGFTYSF